MKTIRYIAVAVFLSALSASASGMSPVGDDGLREVAGGDGLSFMSFVNASIGSITHTDTGPDGGSISFERLGAFGLFGGAIDILKQPAFETILAQAGVFLPASFYGGGDVIQMSVPANTVVPSAMMVDMWMGAARMGGNRASFGSVRMTDVDFRGTTIWVWKR